MAYNLAAIPKWALIDKIGSQLAGGKMYTYQATDKSTPKSVYKDSSGTIAYTNPVIFNSVGQQGPFYWDDTENYYLEVYDKDDVLQWTLDNYNANAGGGGSVNNYFEITNYFLNSNFRFNSAPSSLTASEVKIADGPWYFEKNNTSATDSVTFVLFNLGQTDVDKSPTYYFKYKTTSPGSSETVKDLKFKFNGVRAFSGEIVSISMDAKSPDTDTIDIRYNQHFGTGGSPSSDVGASLATQALTASWDRYEFDGLTIPSISGKTIGDNNDDYIEIIIRMPLNSSSDVWLTNLQLELRSSSTSYEYETDEVNIYRSRGAILPRVIEGSGATGTDNLSITAKSDGTMAFLGNPPVGTVVDFASETPPTGWLLCDGSSYTIVGSSPQYLRLYNVIGQRFGKGADAYFMSDGSSGDKKIATCTTGRVTTAPNAQTSGFAFNITHSGEIPSEFDVYNYSGSVQQSWVEFRNQTVGAVTAPTTGNLPGASLTINQVGSTVLKSIATFTFPVSSSSLAGKYILISNTTIDYYIWFTFDGSGSNPSVGGRTGIQVDLVTGDTANDVAQKVVNKIIGRQIVEITAVAASSLSGGEYFDIYNGTQATRVWFTKDSNGSAPSVTSEYLVQVDTVTGDDASSVATKTKNAMDAIQFQIPDDRGIFTRGWDNSAGNDPESTTRRTSNGEYSSDYVGDHVGTYQHDTNKSHKHQYSNVSSFATATSGGGNSYGYNNSNFDTDYVGSYESRPYNIAYARIIKY